MTIIIGSLEFEGPMQDIDLLSDAPGVYGVLCQSGDEFELLELGESESVRDAVVNHPDRNDWLQHGLDVSFCVHYADDLTDSERAELKDTLEREFDEIDAAA